MTVNPLNLHWEIKGNFSNTGNKINSDFYLQDGLHLNTKGYEIIIKKLKQLLKNLD